MYLIIFGFKTNMRQMLCYICPGCEDNKYGTNMDKYSLKLKPHLAEEQI